MKFKPKSSEDTFLVIVERLQGKISVYGHSHLPRAIFYSGRDAGGYADMFSLRHYREILIPGCKISTKRVFIRGKRSF